MVFFVQKKESPTKAKNNYGKLAELTLIGTHSSYMSIKIYVT